MQYRGQFAQLMVPGLHSTFVHWRDLSIRDSEYDKIFNIETSDNAFEDVAEFAGLGPLNPKPEATAIFYDSAIQGGSKRYLHTPWALGCRTSFELFRDDKYGLIKQVPQALVRSAQFTREQTAFNVFNLGFTNAVLTTDGVSLFNTQHPLLGGAAATGIGPGVGAIIAAAGTFPNRPLTDVDFSYVALQQATDTFERLIDSRGIPTVLKPKLVLGAPALRWLFREVLGSPYAPNTAENQINAMVAEDLNYAIGHYLTSDSAWFLLCDKESHKLRYFERDPLDEDYADDFDTMSLKERAYMRFSVGADSWMGVWGSNGP
jgi:hypothetical protein